MKLHEIEWVDGKEYTIEILGNKNIEVALLINPDRIPVIKRMAEKVLNLKFKDADINWEG